MVNNDMHLFNVRVCVCVCIQLSCNSLFQIFAPIITTLYCCLQCEHDNTIIYNVLFNGW